MWLSTNHILQVFEYRAEQTSEYATPQTGYPISIAFVSNDSGCKIGNQTVKRSLGLD